MENQNGIRTPRITEIANLVSIVADGAVVGDHLAARANWRHERPGNITESRITDRAAFDIDFRDGDGGAAGGAEAGMEPFEEVDRGIHRIRGSKLQSRLGGFEGADAVPESIDHHDS